MYFMKMYFYTKIFNTNVSLVSLSATHKQIRQNSQKWRHSLDYFEYSNAFLHIQSVSLDRKIHFLR